MVIYTRGADPEALERSSRVLLGYSRECESVRQGASNAIRALGAHWGGGDLQALQGQWPATDDCLARLGAQLADLSGRLSSNAQQQRGASGPAGGVQASLPGSPFGPGQPLPQTPPVPPPPPPSVGHIEPRTQKHWWDTAGDALGDAGAWTYNHTLVPAVDFTANVGQAMVEHPEDLLAMALGAGAIVLGSGGEVGGVALDATGVGAVVGVPINIASAALIATGATVMTAGAGDLMNNASQNDNRVLNEATGPSESRPQPGDRLPDEQRPGSAGNTWEGRVARDGKGEVWQKPESIDPPAGKPNNANTFRIKDPEPGYPNGSVRFYNSEGQPLGLDGKPGPNKSELTHFKVRPDGSYDVPKGWNP